MTRKIHTVIFNLLLIWIMLLSVQSFAQNFSAHLQVKTPLNLRLTPSFNDSNTNVKRLLPKGEVLSIVNTIDVQGRLHYYVKDSKGNSGYVYNDPRFVQSYIPRNTIGTNISYNPQVIAAPHTRPAQTTTQVDTGVLMPICGCTSSRCRLTSHYGMRRGHMHLGCDLGSPVGTPVYAMADGVVHPDSGRGWNGAWGNWIALSHSQPLKDNKGVVRSISGWRSEYAHLSKLFVKDGDRVRKGQLIGLTGESGRSRGPHLHVNIRANGSYLDPYKYFEQDSVRYSEARVNTVRSCPAVVAQANGTQVVR